MKKILLSLCLFVGASVFADTGADYKWGEGTDGYGYCFEYTLSGNVLNAGDAVCNDLCGSVTYSWGQATDGYTYCFGNGGGYTLFSGQAVDNSFCGG